MASARLPIGDVIKAHMAASSRKSAVLAILFVVMVGMYARLFLAGPGRCAQAGAVVIGERSLSTAATAAISSSQQNSRPGRLTIIVPVTRELSKDPFQVWFNSSGQVRIEDSEGNRTSVLEQVASLELQVTVSGEDPMAVINGRVLRPNDQIQGFILDRVEPTSVRLNKDGVSLVLKLQ